MSGHHLQLYLLIYTMHALYEECDHMEQGTENRLLINNVKTHADV